MNDITRILSEIERGDSQAADELMPLVYGELRKLAVHKMAQEAPGQTLQATALVHEAYVRLVQSDGEQHWNSRGHFFAAAAEAMRRILVENIRRKRRLKRGGNLDRVEWQSADIPALARPDEMLDLDEALNRLSEVNPEAARLVTYRYFVGFTNEETASLMDISPRKANQIWKYARAWLRAELSRDEQE